jgi:hypothetical protein
MPSWAVTGKLGGGKTLWAVRMIFKYLALGCPVATNIDIFPELFLSPLRDEKNFCLYRLPNNITRADLDMLGMANATNDERKNGLVVIDESGVSLNARTYNDSNRKDLISWFLHARKLGWDLIFIVQSISLIDKQIREAILEYRAVCKRMDRLSFPILAWFGVRVPMPRFHFVIVRYGMENNAVIADRDLFRGNDLFPAFNTKQSLMDCGQQAGVYSVLSPWHLKGRYMSKVRLYRRVAFVAGFIGLLAGLLSGWFSHSGYVASVASVSAPASAPAPVVPAGVPDFDAPVVAVGFFSSGSGTSLLLPSGDSVLVKRKGRDGYIGFDGRFYILREEKPKESGSGAVAPAPAGAGASSGVAGLGGVLNALR